MFGHWPFQFGHWTGEISVTQDRSACPRSLGCSPCVEKIYWLMPGCHICHSMLIARSEGCAVIYLMYYVTPCLFWNMEEDGGQYIEWWVFGIQQTWVGFPLAFS